MTTEQKLNYILNEVAEEWRITPEQVQSKCRKLQFVEPRQVYCKLASILTKATLKEIGTIIENRDHTTVIYSIQHITDIIHTEEHFRNRYEKLLDRLKNSLNAPIEIKSITPPFPGVALLHKPYPKLMMNA